MSHSQLHSKKRGVVASGTSRLANLEIETALASQAAAPGIPVGSAVQLPCGSEVQVLPLVPSLLTRLPLHLISQFGLLGAWEGFGCCCFLILNKKQSTRVGWGGGTKKAKMGKADN